MYTQLQTNQGQLGALSWKDLKLSARSYKDMQGGKSICYEGVTRTRKELQGSARSPISAHLAFQLPQPWEDNLVALSSSSCALVPTTSLSGF